MAECIFLFHERPHRSFQYTFAESVREEAGQPGRTPVLLGWKAQTLSGIQATPGGPLSMKHRAGFRFLESAWGFLKGHAALTFPPHSQPKPHLLF